MDTLNYLLFKNPVSATLIQGTSGALSAVVRCLNQFPCGLAMKSVSRFLLKGITQKSPASSNSQVVLKEVMRPFQSLGCNRVYIRLAGISGAYATILAAVGAHRQFDQENAADLKRIYETANRFHFMSTLALMAIPFTRKPHLVILPEKLCEDQESDNDLILSYRLAP